MAVKPTATEIRNNLEGYNLTTSIVSDAWIEQKRDAIVIPHINSFCRRDFETEEEIIEYHSGTSRDILMLDRKNINSLVSIELVSGNDIDATINLASIQLIAGQGILKVKSGLSQFYNYRTFPKGENNIRVTYKVGGSMPEDIKQAIMDLTSIRMLSLIEGRTGGGSINTQGWSRNFGNMGKYSNVRKILNQDAQAVLRRYSTGVVGS